MEVILLENMRNLGRIGDVVRVRNGYARNFLLPQKKVLRATEENRAVFEARRAEIEAENAARQADAQQKLTKLEGKAVTLVRQAGDDGRLYGSVTARDIARELSDDNVTVDASQVHLTSPIKQIGIVTVEVELYPGVQATFTVNVARSESEAQAALQSEAAANAPADDAVATEEAAAAPDAA